MKTNPVQVSLVRKRPLPEPGFESYTFDVRTKYAVQRYEVVGRSIEAALDTLTRVVGDNLKGSLQDHPPGPAFNEQESTRVTGAVVLVIAGATLGLQWIASRVAKLFRGEETT